MNARERQAAADIASYIRGFNDAVTACRAVVEEATANRTLEGVDGESVLDDLPKLIPVPEPEDAITVDAEDARDTLQALVDITPK